MLSSGRLHAQNDPSREEVRMIFPGKKLAGNYKFHFPGNFKELTLKAGDSSKVSALLFKADSSRGVILYLHGNTGALDTWGRIAGTYTSLGYDVLMPDYRGYGKSEGEIKNEAQLYGDMQAAYNYLKRYYPESRIVVAGYSIGTGPAAYLAANNYPGLLILQAPYYSLADAVAHLAPGTDTADVPFHFNTYQFLPKVAARVVIFHGDKDEMFYYGGSEKLKALFKKEDELITLRGAGHLNMERNKEFRSGLKRVLQ